MFAPASHTNSRSTIATHITASTQRRDHFESNNDILRVEDYNEDEEEDSSDK